MEANATGEAESVPLRLVRHARYAVFQFAEAALLRDVFAKALDLINGLRGPQAGIATA